MKNKRSDTILILSGATDVSDEQRKSELEFLWIASFSPDPLKTIRPVDLVAANNMLKSVNWEGADVEVIPSLIYSGVVFTNISAFGLTVKADIEEMILVGLFDMLRTGERELPDGTRITTNNEIIQQQGGIVFKHPKFIQDQSGFQKLVVWNIEKKKTITVDSNSFGLGEEKENDTF